MKRSLGGRHLLAGVASAALVASSLTAVAATAQESGEGAAGEPAHVEQAVRAELAKDGDATFWVHFDGRPDMSQFSSIADWDARGIAVYDALTKTADRSQAGVKSDLESAGLTYTSFWATNAILVEDADAEVVNELAATAGVDGIYGTFEFDEPDPVTATEGNELQAATWGVQDINADDVWAAGVNGEGMVVANLDSGVQWDHPALKNHYRGWDGSTASHDYNWHDGTVDDEPAPWDWDGHGTHTMGTMIGDDGAGNQVGVAPGAKWMAASTDLSDASIVTAGEWFLAPTKVDGTAPDPSMRPNVINNSWGSSEPSNEPFIEDIIEAWDAAGIFSVWSNGNEGPACETSGSPGSRIITYSVGNYDSFHSISGSSSRGAGQEGEIKPNISAPGTNVRSSVPGNGYANYSGTSMAAPHVAGSIALLWSANPDVVGDIEATRALLDGAAIDTEDLQCGGTAEDNNVFGEGRLDAYDLVFGDEPPVEGDPAISVDPTSIEHTQPADEQSEQTLTVSNTGGADLEYSISEVEAAAGSVDAPVMPQGADRSQQSTEAAGGAVAPAVIEPAAVPAASELVEAFDDVSLLASKGWAVKNNSEPVGGTSWFQGNAADVFPSHEGAPDAYVGANYNSAGESPGNISNWLMTPELDLANGAEFSFWSRTVENPSMWPDRVELRMSTSGDSTNVGSGFEGVGDFDTVLLSVNPDLTDTGYPAEWTQYTATVEGLDAPTTGRFAFRYYVPNGGPVGTASNYIGIDTVSYEGGETAPACEAVDAQWLSVDPTSGTVAPDGSAEVTVGLDSTGLADGDYTAALCIESNDPANPVVNVPVTLTVGEDEGPGEPAQVQRIWGADRYATAAEIAASFPDGADTVYVANGTEAADGADALAMGAAGATGALGYLPGVTPEGDPAPILLVRADQIPAATAAALEALTPSEIVIVGGTNSVSTGVEDSLGETGADVRRIAGEDRYETAALIAGEFGTADTVYVASGQGDMSTGLALADALTASSVAGSQGVPVVLTRTNELPEATAEVIEALGASNVVVVGGPNSVNESVVTELGTIASTDRAWGADRYETAVALTGDYAVDGDMLYIAAGTNFPDALAGSSLTGSQVAPLLLSRGTTLPAATAEEIMRLSPQGITIFGGPNTVSDDVKADLQELLDVTSTD